MYFILNFFFLHFEISFVSFLSSFLPFFLLLLATFTFFPLSSLPFSYN